MWSEWCKTLQDFFHCHCGKLKKCCKAWNKVVRKASVLIWAEQERDRWTGLLFHLAKLEGA